MSAENHEVPMQSPPTATGTPVVVVRRRVFILYRWKVNAVLALASAIVGAGNLVAGLVNNCFTDFTGYDCDSQKTLYITIGSCFLIVAACFLVAAIVLYKKRRKLISLEQSSSVMQPVIATPSYICQPVIAIPTVTTFYPSPYHPPTGPSNNPLSPAANQYSPPAGFTASPEPTESYLHEADKPPSYSP